MNEPMWSPGLTLEDMELQIVERAYSYYRFHKIQTAFALGIAVRTLDAKLEKIASIREAKANEEADRRLKAAYFLARSRGEIPAEPVIEPATEPLDNAVHTVHMRTKKR